MRPVRLDLDGFASFREPTTVDFTDADFFVLVGPTGSGKSTVIDALTFALYGTVPRWSDRRAVKYGLAPTAGPGHGAADLRRRRRSGTSSPASCAGPRAAVSRPQRPAGAAARPGAAVDDDDIESTRRRRRGDAGDRAAARACPTSTSASAWCCRRASSPSSCARKAAERRAMLLKLLGAGLYDQMRTAANQRAALAEERVKGLDLQLARLGPAGDDEIDAAAATVTALNDLGGRLTDLLDDIAMAGVRVEGGRRRIAEIDSGLATLATVQAPDDVDDLARARTEADTRLSAARVAEERTLAADIAARGKLAAAPARAPLESWARAYDEQDRIRLELPGARDLVGRRRPPRRPRPRLGSLRWARSTPPAPNGMTPGSRPTHLVRRTGAWSRNCNC